VNAAAADASTSAAAWDVLRAVPDPELPTVSIVDLGIVREVRTAPGVAGARLEVVLTPTYSGCPATEFIEAEVQRALRDAGLGPVLVTRRLAPAWSSDWISAEGRRRLAEAGIVPPGPASGDAADAQRIHIRPRALPCPRCGSAETERLSAFGSTACKALHRCLACGEPFEHFKPI
jgi:ring-1,2-phenylacetyl-CoA epoxidase subunit PaaD